MACEYYESCNLRSHAPTLPILVKEYESKFCYGGDDAVAECQHRKVLIKINKNFLDLLLSYNF